MISFSDKIIIYFYYLLLVSIFIIFTIIIVYFIHIPLNPTYIKYTCTVGVRVGDNCRLQLIRIECGLGVS